MSQKSKRPTSSPSTNRSSRAGQSISPPDYGLAVVDQQKSEEEAPIQGVFGLPTMQQALPPPSDNPSDSQQQNQTGLPDRLKSGIESLSGYSLDDVQVSYNSPKPARIGAFAYAQGNQIYLGPGQERHLPHEAWHVVQQKQGRVRPSFQMMSKLSVNDDHSLEQEADHMGTKAMRRPASPHFLKHQRARNDVAQLISDNLDHFQEFLASKIHGKGINLTHPSYLKAKASAYILDHNAYKNKLNSLPLDYQGIAHTLPQSGQPNDYLRILQQFIRSIGHANISQITWGPVTKFGTGTSVFINFGPGGHAIGTPTKDKTPWMNRLTARKDGDRTLYVMGHLLNADLGGPGLDYNYVPLTGRAGWYGANDSNALHSKLIEQIVKQKYALLGKNVTSLAYQVLSVKRQKARPETQEIGNTLQAMNAILATRKFSPTQSLSKLTKNVKTQLKKDIKANPVLEAVLYAVSSNNYWSRSWNTLFALVKENHELWKFEDQIVPQMLKTITSWKQDGIDQRLTVNIPIILPNSVAAPYNSNRKSKHKKSSPIQHKSQYSDFLAKKSDVRDEGLPEKIQDFAFQADAASYLLDLNEYDREYLKDLLINLTEYNRINELLKKQLLPNQRHQLETKKSQLESAIRILAQDPELEEIANNPGDQKILLKLIESSSGQLRSIVDHYILGYAKRKNKKIPLSNFVSTGKTPWGSPRKITAYLQPGGHPEGSSAGGDSSWMLKIEERRDASKTLYVRGHMINRHLGGAGLDSNMVPLTGREGWFGANNANGIHSSGIEEGVKNLYANMAKPGNEWDKSKVTNLVYSVEAIMGNHNRKQTRLVYTLTDQFDQLIKGIQTGLTTMYKSKSPQLLKEAYKDYHTREFVKLAQANLPAAVQLFLQKIYEKTTGKYGPNLDPTKDPLKSQIIKDFKLQTVTPQQLVLIWRNNLIETEYQSLPYKGVVPYMLGRSNFTTQFNKPIPSLETEQQKFIQSKIKNIPYLERLLNAVSPTGNYLTENLFDLQSWMIANRDLWVYEDKNVPVALQAWAAWTQYGKGKNTGLVIIPNTLPSDIAAPYQERNK
ncbi:MAG: DUF4157 domain-containing protein [Bacteroidota bacterium]